MLQIYPIILDCVSRVQPILALLRNRDSDLASQMKRAMQSVAQNTSEGAYSRKANRQKHYHLALGSARETLCCIEIAIASRYVEQVDPVLLDQLDRIIGTLVRLALGR